MRVTSITLAFVLIAVAAHPVSADSSAATPVDVGASVRFDVLGSYDLGKELGGPAGGNDLGPASLGVELFAGIRPFSKLRLAAELGLALGGLVGTDERYYGERSEVGSTSMASAKASVGYTLGGTSTLEYRAGAVAGAERLSESTSLGYVHLSGVTAGVWLELATVGGWSAQLRAEVHKPWRASIQGQVDGVSPGGEFFKMGLAAAYRFTLLWL